MATLYAVKDWNEHFETHETRKLKNLDWTRLPNKQDGLGFRQIAAHPKRVELFCAWTLIVQVASKSPREQRGQLIRGNLPLSPAKLATITGFPESIFSLALSFFSDPEIGWLESREIPSGNNGIPTSPETSGENPENLRTNGMEGNRTIPPIVPQKHREEPGDFESFWSHYPPIDGRRPGKKAAAKAWQKISPTAWQAAVMMAAVDQERASPKWRESGGKFIPHASTWLNGARWEDVVSAVKPPEPEIPPEWNGLQVWQCRSVTCPDGGIHESPNRAAVPAGRKCPHVEVAHA